MLRFHLLPCLLLACVAAEAPAAAAIVIFEEQFGAVSGETSCTPAFPAGWTRIDGDGRTPDEDSKYGQQAWQTTRDPFDLAGNCTAVSSSWYDPVGASDDWLITPLIHVPRGATLRWRSLAEDPTYPETYRVRYSFTTPTKGAFLDNPVLASGFEDEGTWTERSIALDSKGLGGRAVYLAFQNISNNALYLHVDDVEITIDDTIFGAEFGGKAGGLCSPSFPTGWTRHDLDGLEPLPDFSFVTSAWVAASTAPDDPADCAAFSTSAYVSPGQADDWMITPAIALPADAELRWEASAFTDDPLYRDGYEVWISTTATTPAGFLANPEQLELSIAEENQAWTARAIDLDAIGYGGQTVRIAFRNHSTDESLLAIDSVEVAIPIVFRDGFESGFPGAWAFATGFAL